MAPKSPETFVHIKTMKWDDKGQIVYTKVEETPI